MSSRSSIMLRHARAALQCARLGNCGSKWTASFATAAVDEAAAQPSTSGSTVQLRTKQLTAQSVGAHYLLDEKLVPEAGRAYAGAFYAPRDAGHERKGGCKALQQEAEATGSHAVMYRPAMHALFAAVERVPKSAAAAAAQGESQDGAEAGAKASTDAAAAAQRQRLLLTGPGGSGKSIALVGLVEWARQHGWLVLYVPSCLSLVRGGYFSRREGGGRGSGWDTLTSAQQLLKGLVDAHGERLRELRVRPDVSEAETKAAAERAEGRRRAAREATGQAAGEDAEEAAAEPQAGREEAGRESLYDIAAYGLMKDDDAEAAVEAVRSVVRQLIAASASASGTGAEAGAGGSGQPLRVLFALDDYNCLHGVSDYGELMAHASPQMGRRRVLHSDELILARSMRLLDAKELGGAVVVAANMAQPPMPAPRPYAPHVPYTVVEVQPYSEAETRNALAHYFHTGHAGALPTSRQARQLHALTQGNARQLREHASALGLALN